MTLAYWPLAGITVRDGPLELRPPTPAECHTLAEAASQEHCEPGVPYLSHPTDDPVQRGRRTLQNLWHEWGTWHTARWSLTLAAFHHGQMVGLQNIRACHYAQRREVLTGTWTFRCRRGQGHALRAGTALLHLVFDGLGAHRALALTADCWRVLQHSTGIHLSGITACLSMFGTVSRPGRSRERLPEQRKD
ncbi:GNAT family N-acetyltransferase [Streptomyces boncukensis]|uniref:GNAT family N-acetyltransferase n=1 Tax=Streptomyces boncukensis TaxID=2711219 RepID=A0A6G4X3I8_9ACTN|nr:GNAT family N-acetyltransferase [Streptomyces boncukensis]NGO72099.1 GNAT family N-acetyltransferase [Streptomyces boncukensis]